MVLPVRQGDEDNAAMSIGQVIRALRLERDLTQEELALEAEVAPSNISRIERGERQPTGALLNRLAKALNVSVSQIYTLLEEKENSIKTSKYEALNSGVSLDINVDLVHQLVDVEPNDNAHLLLRYFRELTPENQELLLEQAKLLRRFQ